MEAGSSSKTFASIYYNFYVKYHKTAIFKLIAEQNLLIPA